MQGRSWGGENENYELWSEKWDETGLDEYPWSDPHNEKTWPRARKGHGIERETFLLHLICEML